MKYFLLFLFTIISLIVQAQFAPESDPHRGMYIDKFVKTPLYSNSILDPDFSILGVDENHDGVFEKEDDLLNYASENHITYIALFDLHRIFGRQLMVWDENQNRIVDLEDHLNRFMIKAKSMYGITQIGAIGGSANFFDSLSSFMLRYPLADFDVVNIEYEFWMDCPNEFPNYIPLLQAMYTMKENYNLTHPDNLIISEVYLADLYACNGSFGNLPVVESVDGCKSCSPCAGCSNPHPRWADRVLHAWFVVYPGSVNLAEQNIFENAATEDSTDFHPILYAESYNTGGTVDWTGIWFSLNPENNIFTAEEAYYTSWRNNTAVAFGSPRQNDVQPGGVHWFSSTNMVGHLNQPAMLQNTGPYCSSNPTSLISFNYFGPIEKDIAFKFWITRDSDSITVYPNAGGKVTGVSGIYQALTSTTSLIKNIDFSDTLLFKPCYLPQGNYTAHLLLTYENPHGNSYQCDNTIIVDSQPRIAVVGKNQFCEGDFTYLRINNVGGTVTWFRNGIQISGNTSDLLVTTDGDYSCLLNGGSGCSGLSDTIHINVLSNPAIAMNAVCNGNGTATIKTNLLPANTASGETSGPGGVLYQWNTGDSTDQITVTPPSTNTYYRVNVTNPYTGCMRTGQIGLRSPLVQPYVSSIVINSQPSSACASDGSLTATILAGGSPNNYLWSNGETTQTISNLSPGTYSVAMNVWASGCTSFNTVTIGSQTGNAPVIQAVIQDANCSGEASGSINLNIAGGNPPFTYQWEFFPNDSIHNRYEKDQTTLFEGNYFVKIKDVFGCNFTDTFEVSSINASPFIQSVSTVDVTGCASSSNGSAVVNAAGGSFPYSYQWFDAMNQTTATATNLPAGSVKVNVTDANGCIATDYVSISSTEFPLQLLINEDSNHKLSCVGEQDASLNLIVLGGTDPYVVSMPWSISGNTVWIDSLATGMYPLLISDASSCLLYDTFYVDNPDEPEIFTSSVQTSCISCVDGELYVSMDGGEVPYQISWQPMNGILTGNTIHNLPGGIYTICMSDNNGCSVCAVDTVFESPSEVFSLDINSVINVYPNPFSDFTKIKFSCENLLSCFLVVSDLKGEIVLNRMLTTASLILTKDDLFPGVYFIRLFDLNNQMISGIKKLVVLK